LPSRFIKPSDVATLFLYTAGFNFTLNFIATGMNTLVSIAIPSPLRRHFDYLWPAELTAPRPGERVLVPFGNRRLVATVLDSLASSDVPTKQLKSVLERLDQGEPAISKDLLALARWAASYYHHPIGECLQQILPVALRKATPPKIAATTAWQAHGNTDELAPLPKQAHQQRALLKAIQQNGQLSRRQIKDMGFSNSVLNALIKGHYLSPCAETTPTPPAPQPPLTPNPEQAAAVNTLTAALGRFERFLLEGVTGSGKTEVYLQAIHSVLQRGQQALVLVPEIGLTPQTLARFEQRYPGQVVALHSGLNDNERYRNWQAIKHGKAAIVLGTRSAVLCDFAELGLIIVDEEHDASYKQQDGWHYSARDIAVKRAADWSCPVLLASATPSLDSLYNVKQGRYQQLVLQQRAGDAKPPSQRLIDIRQQPLDEGLSPLLFKQIEDTLHAGNQALVFLNRRGFAPLVQCHSCGWMAECESCDARMTVHFNRRELRCHHCDARGALPSHCPQCQNSSLTFQGPGTERLEMALKRRFADTPVIRIDRDTTSNKGSMQTLVDRIHNGDPAVLVGTQMLAKGHHFPDVTLVAVVDIDGGLFSPDFRAGERTGQLLLQVAGRAGRGDKPGTVLIQTHCPDHPVLQQLVHSGYAGFADTLMAERELMGLPPCSFMAVMRCDAKQLSSAEQFLTTVSQGLQNHKQCDIIGPLPAPMARRAGRFRCSLLFQAAKRSQLHTALNQACHVAEQQRRLGDLRWSIDVDPIEMF
jgi:primosomal protein N' (replication factor Y)